jgi:hypothetical protein
MAVFVDELVVYEILDHEVQLDDERCPCVRLRIGAVGCFLLPRVWPHS